MTRGRKKDLSIPASRALTQQRDYRTRKALYVSELEERCRQAEAENAHLRKELEFVRAGEPVRQVAFSHETATSDLMQHLSAASISLARFQQLAFTDSQRLLASSLPTGSTWSLRPASFPSPGASSSFSSTASFYPHHNPRPNSLSKQTNTPDITVRQSPSPSPSIGEECCGGIIDCRDLVEEEEHVVDDHGDHNRPTPSARMSGLRSTSKETDEK